MPEKKKQSVPGESFEYLDERIFSRIFKRVIFLFCMIALIALAVSYYFFGIQGLIASGITLIGVIYFLAYIFLRFVKHEE